MNIIANISMSLQSGNHSDVARLTREALSTGLTASSILEDGLIAGMDLVGQKFSNHEIFLPDVLMSARAMESGVEVLKPHLARSAFKGKGLAVIGTVKGDLHDIGKNLVAIMLKGAGYEILDLGRDVPAEQFVNTALENNADIIGLSALLTTTMPTMKATIDLLREKDREEKIKVIIGGAPTSRDYAEEIGADGYAFDAVSAVKRVKDLLYEN